MADVDQRRAANRQNRNFYMGGATANFLLLMAIIVAQQLANIVGKNDLSSELTRRASKHHTFMKATVGETHARQTS
jgi:hypothetical protein